MIDRKSVFLMAIAAVVAFSLGFYSGWQVPEMIPVPADISNAPAVEHYVPTFPTEIVPVEETPEEECWEGELFTICNDEEFNAIGDMLLKHYEEKLRESKIVQPDCSGSWWIWFPLSECNLRYEGLIPQLKPPEARPQEEEERHA
jgi:hypothetical protein